MHRTNTTNLSTITLPFPDAATFDFTSPDVIRITIPPSSTWHMRLHWHPSEKNGAAATNTDIAAACRSVKSVSGPLHVYIATGLWGSYDKLGSTGMSVKFKPGQRISWNRLKQHAAVPLTVDLATDHALWRNICSVVTDRAIFPRLSSTPLWLRALFAILAVVLPTWRERLLDKMLWMQLQAIFFAHDFHMYYGYVPVTWPWIAQPFGGQPPAWATRLQVQSFYIIAKVVMTWAYWVGILFLGMKGEYVEYTPRRGYEDEKRQTL